MFTGSLVHDSQELCNYVLDKLHEDVNRVRSKPYVENFEANGEPDVARCRPTGGGAARGLLLTYTDAATPFHV